MLALIAVILVTYLLTSLVVGVCYFALFGHRIATDYDRLAFVGLFVVFVVLDMYWIPAVAGLDMTITFRDPEIAKAFGAEPGLRVNDTLTFGWLDVIAWFIQTIIGYFAGAKIYKRALKRGLTRR